MGKGEILLGLLLGSALLGQLIQIPLLGLDIAPLDFVVGFSVIYGFWALHKDKQLPSLWKLPLVKIEFALIAAVMVSWLFAIPAIYSDASALVVSLMYAVRLCAYLVLPVILVGLLDVSKSQLHSKILLGAGVVMACFGFLQLALFPDFQIYDHLGWDPHKHRLIGSFLDPNYTAIWLSLMAGLSVAAFFGAAKSRFWFASITGLLVFAALLTVSRSGLLALVGVFFAVAFLYFRKWALPLLLAGILLVTTVPALSARISSAVSLDTTVRYRLESWEGALNVFKQNPLFGVGYNTLKFRRYEDALPGTSKLISRFEDGIIRSQQLTSRADGGFDSSLLTLLATTGTVGLLVFLWWVWRILAEALAHYQKHPNSIWSSWVISATAGLLLSSWFVNAWLYSPILLLWLISVALFQKELHSHE